MHHPENIERHEQKKSGSVEIKLRGHLVKEFRLIKGNGDSFSVIAIVLQLCQQNERLLYRVVAKESAITTAGCTRSCVAVSPVWIQSKRKSITWLHHISHF